MKTKKSRRLLSLILAVVMAFSAMTATISAQAAYQPTYGEKAPKEDFALLIEDADTLLNTVLTGDTIEMIWAAMPALSVIINTSGQNGSDTAQCYVDYDAEIFANLPDYAEEDGTVTADTLNAFFAENPIEISSQSEFAAALNHIVDFILMPNVMQTLIMIPLFGMGEQANELAAGLDSVCAALGIEQERTAGDVLGFATFQGDEAGAETYVHNIVNAVFADNDAVNNILDMLRTALDAENFATLCTGLKGIFSNLNDILSVLSSTLGLDLGSISSTIDTIAKAVACLAPGEDGLVDLNAAIPEILNALGAGAVTSLITIPEIDLSHVAETQDNADLVKAVYDWLYELISVNKNALTLAIDDPQGDAAFSLLESLIETEIPSDVEATVLSMLSMSNDDMAYELLDMVQTLAGREDPVPEDPSTGPTDPTPEEPTTGNEPTTGKEPTTGGKEPTTTNGKLPAVNSNNPDLPNTGRTADYITAASAMVAVISGLALVYIVLFSKKKITE